MRGRLGRRHSSATTAVAVALGLGLAVTLAAIGAFWPALVVLAGAGVSAGVILIARGVDKHYLVAGTVYCLGLALAFEAGGTASFPAIYPRDVVPGTAGVGVLSALLLGAKVGVRRGAVALARWLDLDETYLAQLADALSSLGHLLVLAWLVITWSEKVLRYGGSTVALVGLLVLNALEVRYRVDPFGLEVEAVFALFVVSVLMLFSLLDTLHNSWRAASMTAQRARGRASTTDGETGTDAVEDPS